MRKLILISAFVIAASVSAEAGQSRGLVLAANDDPAPPAAAQAVSPPPAQPAATAQPAPAAQPAAAAAEPAKAETPAQASKAPKKAHAHSWRDDEAKARRIAAKYGVYW